MHPARLHRKRAYYPLHCSLPLKCQPFGSQMTALRCKGDGLQWVDLRRRQPGMQLGPSANPVWVRSSEASLGPKDFRLFPIEFLLGQGPVVE